MTEIQSPQTNPGLLERILIPLVAAWQFLWDLASSICCKLSSAFSSSAPRFRLLPAPHLDATILHRVEDAAARHLRRWRVLVASQNDDAHTSVA